MVFGIFGGLLTPIFGIVDFAVGNFNGGLAALGLTIVIFAICATTPSKPGYSALAFVVVAVVMVVFSSVSTLAGLLLLIAAFLGGVAALAMRRRTSRVT